MERTPGHYWNKVAILNFSDLDLDEKWELARKVLGKDELAHLKKLVIRARK